MNILWGRSEGPYPGIASKYTLSWWLRVSGDPAVGEQVGILILRGFKWIGELLANFPWIFGGVLVGEAICMGGS